MKLAPLFLSLLVMLVALPARAQEAPPVDLTAGGAGASVAVAGEDRWAVLCQRSGEVSCVVRQYLVREEDRRQVMMAGLLPATRGETASMRLVLPFGLDPVAPVTIGIDGAPLADPPLRTCLPGGCETTLAIDEDGLARLRRGSRLEIGLRIAGGGNVALPVDLAGFSAAFDAAVSRMGEGEPAR